jgi:hypothetical protein
MIAISPWTPAFAGEQRIPADIVETPEKTVAKGRL